MMRAGEWQGGVGGGKRRIGQVHTQDGRRMRTARRVCGQFLMFHSSCVARYCHRVQSVHRRKKDCERAGARHTDHRGCVGTSVSAARARTCSQASHAEKTAMSSPGIVRAGGRV
jgi:hypothetical protein